MSVTGFLAYLEVERRVSAHTLGAYRRGLAALTEWAQAHGITELADVQSEALRGFVAAEHRRGLSPKSLQRRLSACRARAGSGRFSLRSSSLWWRWRGG